METVNNEPGTDVQTAPLNVFDLKAQRLQQMREELQQEEDDLAEQRRLADEAERQRKLNEYEQLREDASGFRATAAKTDDEASKETYVRWALDADKQAIQLARELGLAIEEPVEETPEEASTLQKVTSLLRHRLAAVVQVFFLGVAIWWASSNFTSIGERIKVLNKDLPVEQMMNAYDLTSNQKFFFEKYVEFWDIPGSLFKLLIVAPFIALYLLPFFRSRKDFFTEFFEDLTPFQRCVITLAFVALFVLHSALSHGVKP